ncbi:MAG: MarR family transcriptional regulator [Streptosporangiales bacterium]|nr:MarR family transcriptional regulator [Streptosporangiales bacterium]
MAVSAVATMVWSTDAMNSASDTIAKTILRRGCGSPPPVADLTDSHSTLLAGRQRRGSVIVDTDTLIRMRAVIGRLARQLNTTATGEGLTPTQASVLGLISARGPLGLAELTELEHLNPTMLSRVIGKLTEWELIRKRPAPTDQRAVMVEVTEAGDVLFDRVRLRRSQVIAQCLDRLPADAVTKVVDALPALEALAEELRVHGGSTGPPPPDRP